MDPTAHAVLVDGSTRTARADGWQRSVRPSWPALLQGQDAVDESARSAIGRPPFRILSGCFGNEIASHPGICRGLRSLRGWSEAKPAPDELRERSVRIGPDSEPEHSTRWEAICSVAEKRRPMAETMRQWIFRAETDSGRRPGATTVELAESKRENERAGARPWHLEGNGETHWPHRLPDSEA